MNIDDYLGLPYTIELTPDHDDDGRTGWVAEVEELPGCITQVDALDELEASIRDAMTAWISVALEDGRDIPAPRSEQSYSGRFLLRLPKSLHGDLAHEAEREGVSLNQLVTSMLAASVGWHHRLRETA
ncbi:MAG TPA: type II toxin-antitoxin system HicB family antitoxin [Gaiellales bacterium]|nr:type II toxin-antitoxin system HicB family antitoxin [Gaiellales bacterium]